MTTTGEQPLATDWAIVGCAWGDGVRVIATKNVKPGGKIEVVEKTRDVKIMTSRGPQPTVAYEPDGWRITVLAEEVVIVDGRDYVEALGILMRIWQPPSPAPATPVKSLFAGVEHFVLDGDPDLYYAEPGRVEGGMVIIDGPEDG